MFITVDILQPSRQPRGYPSDQPTMIPSIRPTSQPTCEPSTQPSLQPVRFPSGQPSRVPQCRPTCQPTGQPKRRPSRQPNAKPTRAPSRQPNRKPSSRPSRQPAALPTKQPNRKPTSCPSLTPSAQPSRYPSILPTTQPTRIPSSQPSRQPMRCPTSQPVRCPTGKPSKQPARLPSAQPSLQPLRRPSSQPSKQPNCNPTLQPFRKPSRRPSSQPFSKPTQQPTSSPSHQPKATPTGRPSRQPSRRPSTQPTYVPSSAPSHQPRRAPTSQPLGAPTARPSSQMILAPTCQPSRRPSRQPNSSPSRQPTAKPSRQSSSKPSRQPSKQPSKQPAGSPTRQPIGRPSMQPVRRPSSQPSRDPTSQSTSTPTNPTSQPSRQPSLRPTATPTSRPKIVPSAQPIRRPSRQPFSRPTMDPSRQPQRRPTSRPTLQDTQPPTKQPFSSPSAQPRRCPSVQPSSQPQMRPSDAPTSQPTHQPSNQPSVRPTGQPTTSRPSSRPTGVPTNYPTTFVPTTTSEKVIKPRRLPTSMPTFNTMYLPSSQYQNYLTTAADYNETINGYSYTSFDYKTLSVAGGCNSWNAFVKNDLASPFDYFQYVRFNVSFNYYDTKTRSVQIFNTTCSNPTAVSKIVSSLQKGTAQDVNCNHNLWRVFPCSESIILCVNCKRSCAASVLCPGRSFSFGSCVSSGCDGRSIASTFFAASYSLTKLYPLFLNLNATTNQTSAVVTATLSTSGSIHCAAFLYPSSGVTLQLIQAQQFSSYALSNNEAVSVELLDLQPSTAYDIVCYTADSYGHVMPLAEALATTLTVSTRCCKSVVVLSKVSSIIQSSATAVSSDLTTFVPQFYFGLNARPAASATLSFNIRRVACPNAPLQSGATDVRIYPSTYTFSRNAYSLSNGFLVQGVTVGCYQIQSFVKGSDYLGANVTFVIQNSKTSLPAPVVSNVVMSNDGGHVSVLFDSPTNGLTIASSKNKTGVPFNCSALLRFTGYAASSCIWTSFTQLDVYIPSGTGYSNRPSVGGSLTLLGNTIQALCSTTSSSCSSYPYTPSTTIAISTPSNPIKPMVLLSSPSTVNYCDDIVIDPTFSTGNVGRAWVAVEWNVSTSPVVQSAAAVLSHLAKYARDTNAAVIIPNSILSPGNSYQFTLTLTNEYGQVSSGSTKVTMSGTSNNVISPVVRLVSLRSLFRWQQVQVFADVTTPSICGVSSTNSSVTFEWKLYQGTQYVDSIESTSLDPRYFLLPPYSVQAGTFYTISVTVFLHYKGYRTLARDSTDISVGVSGVRAFIKGGASRTVSISDKVTLDASGSYEVDYPNSGSSSAQGLQFLWSCVSLLPVYGNTCGLSSDSLSSPILSFAAQSLGTQQLYNLSLTVFTSSGSRAGSSVLVYVTSSTASSSSSPSVTILTSPRAIKYNVGNTLEMTGNVSLSSSSRECTARWSSPAISDSLLASFATTPLSMSLPLGVTAFQLSMRCDGLVSGAVYSFKLAVSCESQSSSAATILITMNRPPSGGYMSVNPSSGTAMSTIYTLSTAGWTDDASDLPLSYQFSYTLPSASAVNILKPFDFRVTTSSYIGQGQSRDKYAVICVSTASDIFDGFALSNYTITVSASAVSSALITQSADAYSSAFKYSNADKVTQVTTALIATVNSVDCSVSATCASLNRQSCLYTARTCGPCLSGYVGISGDSNKACGLAQQLNYTGQSCFKSTDCATGICTNGICGQGYKTCPSGCSGKGTCVYYESLGGSEIASCNVSSSFCTASCRCSTGFYGRDCSLSLSVFEQSTALRTSMCANLLKAMPLQRVTADIILQRAVMIRNAFVDPTQITTGAVWNCSTVLIQTIAEYPSLSCSTTNQYQLLSALSQVLTLAPSIPTSLLQRLSAAVSTLSAQCLSYLAVDEAPVELFLDNLRVFSFLASSSANRVGSTACVDTSSAFEQTLNQPPAYFCLNLSSLASQKEVIGISVQKYLFNALQSTSPASSFIVTSGSIASIGTATTQNSRRLAAAQDSFLTTLTFQNKDPITYTTVNQVNITVECTQLSEDPYLQAGICPNGMPYNVTCPANLRGRYEVACAGFVTVPKCTVLTGIDRYAPSSDCFVQSFNRDYTTCECLQDMSFKTQEYSSTYVVEKNTQYETFHVYAVPEKTTEDNIIVSAGSCVTGMLVVGLLCFAIFESMTSKEQKKKQAAAETESKYRPGGSDKEGRVRTVESFFESIVPEDVKCAHWLAIFSRRLRKDHAVIRIFDRAYSFLSTARPEESLLGPWTLLMGRILVIFFVDTVMTAFFNPDDDFCANISSSTSCEAHSERLDAFGFPFHHCAWEASSHSCVFVSLSTESFAVIVLWTFSILFLSVPLFKLQELLCRHCQRLFTNISKQKVTPFARLNESNPVVSDEFLQFQRFKSTMLRAAGLVLAQRYIDFVTLEEEVEDIRRLFDEDTRRLDANSISKSFVDTSSFLKVRHGFKHAKVSRTEVMHRVARSRLVLNTAVREVEACDSALGKEAYLMKLFLTESFSGGIREVVKKFLSRKELFDSDAKVPVTTSVMCAVGLVIWYAGMTYYILRIGLLIGSKSSMLWLVTALISVGEDMFLLQPLGIAFQWIVATSSFREELAEMVVRLKSRSKLMIMRSGGVLRNYRWLVQHMNPACRLSRLQPLCALPIARLLMAVNDFDIPVYQRLSRWRYLYFLYCAPRDVVRFVVSLPLRYLPVGLDEVVIELFSVVFVYVWATGFYLFAHYCHTYLYPAVAIGGLLLTYALVEMLAVWMPKPTANKSETARPVARTRPRADSNQQNMFDSIDQLSRIDEEGDADGWEDVQSVAYSEFAGDQKRDVRQIRSRSVSSDFDRAMLNTFEEKEASTERVRPSSTQAHPQDLPKAKTLAITEVPTTTGAMLEEDSFIDDIPMLSARLKPYGLPINTRFTRPRSAARPDLPQYPEQQQQQQQLPATQSLLDLMPPSLMQSQSTGGPLFHLVEVSESSRNRSHSQRLMTPQASMMLQTVNTSRTEEEHAMTIDNILSNSRSRTPSPSQHMNVYSLSLPVSHTEDQSAMYDTRVPSPVEVSRQQFYEDSQPPLYPGDDVDSVLSNAERQRSSYQRMRKRSTRKKSARSTSDEGGRTSGRAGGGSESGRPPVGSSARKVSDGDGSSVTRSVSSYRRYRRRETPRSSRRDSNEHDETKSEVPETAGNISARRDGPGAHSATNEPSLEDTIESARLSLARKMTLVGTGDDDDVPVEHVVAPPFFREDSMKSLDSISQASSRIGPGSNLYRADK